MVDLLVHGCFIALTPLAKACVGTSGGDCHLPQVITDPLDPVSASKKDFDNIFRGEDESKDVTDDEEEIERKREGKGKPVRASCDFCAVHTQGSVALLTCHYAA